MAVGTADTRTGGRPGLGPHRSDDKRARRSDLGRRARSAHIDHLNRAVVGLWGRRLLTRARAELGSAAIESTFALLFLLVLVLGTIEVAFALYGRNVILSAAH